MHYMVGFVLLLIGSVFVLSAPVVRQATDPLTELLGGNADFDEFIASMASTLSSDQFELFQQDFLELISSESNEDLSFEEFEAKFLILLEKYLGSDFGSRSDFQHLAQKFVNAVVAALPDVVKNTLGKRQATGPLAELLGLNGEFDEFIALMGDILSPAEFESFQQDLLEFISSEITEELNPEDIEAKFIILLEKYLGSDFGSRSDFQHLAQKFVNAVVAALPDVVKNTLGKRQATGPLAEIIGSNDKFDEFIASMADILSPAEFESFQQDLLEFISSEITGELNPEEIRAKFIILLEKYVVFDFGSRSDFQHLAQKFVNAIVAAFPDVVKNTLGKRQATDDLDAILAAAPQLAALINPINDVLAQLSPFLSPDQFKSFQQQAIQLILSLAASNIDGNQFKERLQALVQHYLDSNGRYQVDIDKLIQQVVGTDTAGLPSFILDIFNKNNADVNK